MVSGQSDDSSKNQDAADGAIWVIHAGQQHRFADDFVRLGMVALAAPPDCDLRGRDRSEIAALMREGGTAAGRAIGDATIRLRFIDEMQKGDIILTPVSAGSAKFAIRRIVGDYSYAPDSPIPGMPHTRRVHWLGTLRRDEMDPQLQRSILSPLAL